MIVEEAITVTELDLIVEIAARREIMPLFEERVDVSLGDSLVNQCPRLYQEGKAWIKPRFLAGSSSASANLTRLAPPAVGVNSKRSLDSLGGVTC